MDRGLPITPLVPWKGRRMMRPHVPPEFKTATRFIEIVGLAAKLRVELYAHAAPFRCCVAAFGLPPNSGPP